MDIVRFREAAGTGGDAAVGLRTPRGTVAIPGVARMADLWAIRRDELREVLTVAPNAPDARDAGGPHELDLLAPVDGRTEVWAAGVTYKVSQAARVDESRSAASAYELVYDAERPELFFKAAAWRVAGPGEAVSVRADSTWDVPEPELALVVNRYAEVVGVTACDDVSSRSIEGENPLYLPQAKVYLGSCAVGPCIRPIWEVGDPYNLSIEMTVRRAGQVLWQGTTSTAQLHRRYEDLVEHLFRAERFPDGVVLSTGTCLVPAPPFCLQHGDVVEVTVEGVGTLVNPVVRGLEAMEAAASPELRRALVSSARSVAGSA